VEHGPPTGYDQQAYKHHAQTWAGEVQTYEHQKRHGLNPDLMRGPPVRVTYGLLKQQERMFDPICQRYRDPDLELGMRVREEENRVQHLNRAMDIQLLREQTHNIVNNASRLEGLAPQVDPSMFAARRIKNTRPKIPETFNDYNILSNLPFSQHHWAPPEARPLPLVKEPKTRKIPSFLVKDFNIVNNRYLEQHDEKGKRDHELNLLECTAKFRTRNKFDPITQEFNDPDEESRLKAWSDAHEVEMVQIAQAKTCPTQKNRITAFYNPVSHEVSDGDMLKWMDLAEEERKERFKNRYIMQHKWHLQDIKGDHINEERKLNKVSLRRWDGSIKRGYCIVSHQNYHGRHASPLYCPYTRPEATTWERACNGTIDSPADQATPVPPGAPASEVSSGQPCESKPRKKFSPKRKSKTPPEKEKDPSQVSTASSGAGALLSATQSDIPRPTNTGEGAEVMQIGGGGPLPQGIPAPRKFNEPKKKTHNGGGVNNDTTSSCGSRSKNGRDGMQNDGTPPTKLWKPKNVTVMSTAGSVIRSPDKGSECRSESLPSRKGAHAEQHIKHSVPKIPMPRPATPGYMPPAPPSVPGSDKGSVYSRPIN